MLQAVDARNKCGHDEWGEGEVGLMPAPPLAARSECSYTSPDTEPGSTMKRIGASEARMHLPRLLDRAAQGESLTITRHGKPVARLIPVAHHRERAHTRIQKNTQKSFGKLAIW